VLVLRAGAVVVLSSRPSACRRFSDRLAAFLACELALAIRFAADLGMLDIPSLTITFAVTFWTKRRFGSQIGVWLDRVLGHNGLVGGELEVGSTAVFVNARALERRADRGLVHERRADRRHFRLGVADALGKVLETVDMRRRGRSCRDALA
jgi:hypothetical protein